MPQDWATISLLHGTQAKGAFSFNRDHSGPAWMIHDVQNGPHWPMMMTIGSLFHLTSTFTTARDSPLAPHAAPKILTALSFAAC